MSKHKATYVLYHKGRYFDEGTVIKLSRMSGLAIENIKWLASPSGHKRQASFKKQPPRWEAYKSRDLIGDDDDE